MEKVGWTRFIYRNLSSLMFSYSRRHGPRRRRWWRNGSTSTTQSSIRTASVSPCPSNLFVFRGFKSNPSLSRSNLLIFLPQLWHPLITRLRCVWPDESFGGQQQVMRRKSCSDRDGSLLTKTDLSGISSQLFFTKQIHSYRSSSLSPFIFKRHGYCSCKYNGLYRLQTEYRQSSCGAYST